MDDGEWIRVEVDEVPWVVSVRLGVIEGRTRLVGLQVEPADGAELSEAVISSERLRNFPVRQVLRAAIDTMATNESAEWTEIVREPGKAIPEEHYAFVASAYSMAVESGRSPNAFICQAWGVSRATANTWMREAKHRGFISDSEGGKR